ncbi:MAG: tetratricopeptide repeat protein [Synechococcales bacterium]|nr:tetratricopeptide repeat protein [Synechococcales bacterium]
MESNAMHQQVRITHNRIIKHQPSMRVGQLLLTLPIACAGLLGISPIAASHPADSGIPGQVEIEFLKDLQKRLQSDSTVIAQIDPQAVSAVAREGYVLLQKGWVNDAIVAFQKAIQRSPENVDARLGLAIAYQRAGQDSKAWDVYQQVMGQDRRNVTALSAIGTLGGYRPEWQAQGIAALTTLLQLQPNNSAALAQRALLYGYQGKHDLALADYAPLLANSPTPAVMLNAAEIYSYHRDYAKSVTWFERYLTATSSTVQKLPDQVIAPYGNALRNVGRNQEAIALLRSRLNGNSNDRTQWNIRSTLAVAYAANQQPDLALETLQPLKARSGNQPDSQLALARALRDVGRLSQNSSLSAEAVNLYREVVGQSPTVSLSLLLELAEVLESEEVVTVPALQRQRLQVYGQILDRDATLTSIRVKQLILAQQLGSSTPAQLTQQLQQALTPLPRDATEKRSIALALIPLDPPDPALQPIYEQLVQSELDLPFLEFRLAQINLQRNQLPAAKTALDRYRTTAQGSETIAAEFLLAEIDRRDGNWAAAVQRYEGLLKRELSDRQRTDALKGLAGIRTQQQRYAEALQLYSQVRDRSPNDIDAQRIFADLNLAQDRPTAALQQLQQIQQQQPSPDPQLERRIQKVKADILQRRGFQPSWERY